MPQTPQSKDTLNDARIGEFAGQPAIYFNASLHWNHRKFVITRDALQALDDAVLPTAGDLRHAFDTHVRRIAAKVVDILSVGAHVGEPIVLQASDFGLAVIAGDTSGA